MSLNFAPAQGATHCTGGPAPGARALLAWLREEYEPPGRSMGIYNCRTVRGGSTTSLHGEGRAVDWGWPMSSSGRGTASGERIVSRLGAHGRRLGIQRIIYNRKIWSAANPGGGHYGGVHPHFDHLHIELTRAAGSNLTLATLRSVLGASAGDTEEDDVYVVRYGQSNDRVKRAQVVLRAAGREAGLGDLLPRFGADGDYGNETADAVDAMARRVRGAEFPQEGRTGFDVLLLDYCRNWLSG